MLVWMLYVIVVSILLGGAALAAEQANRIRRGRTRWVWVLGIVASLLVPAVISSVSIQLPQIPSVVSPTSARKIVSLKQATSKALSPANWMGVDARRLSARPSVDRLLRRGWGAASSIILAVLIASGIYLHLRKRSWKRDTIGGVSVYVTDDVGPAVVGLLRPRVVVPRWLCDAPAVTQQLVIAHEQAHLEAHDVRLLTAGVLLLVAMPWNLPMWWQLRRLRCAIEVDCDARVLDAGRDAVAYGETLISVGQRQSGFVGAVAGMSESKSFLEQRINLMVRKPVKWWQVPMGALAALSLALFAVAAQVEPPNVSGVQNGKHHEIRIDPSALDHYPGSYQIGETELFVITREGQQLFAQVSGQDMAPIYPESLTEFFYRYVNVQISFVADTDTNAKAIVVHQDGVDMTLPRIDGAKARQIAANLAAKIESQRPTPGSEAVVNRLIAGIASGTPDYQEMTPSLAEAARQNQSGDQAFLAKFGPVLSIEFLGIGAQGWETYLVKQERGVTQVRVNVSSKGILSGALLTTGP